MDIKTLMITAAALSIAASVVFGVAYGTRKTYPGFGFWTAAVFLNALGAVLFVVRTTPPSWVNLVVSNTLLVAAFVLLYRGMLVFRGRKVSYLMELGVMASFVALISYTSLDPRGTNARIPAYALYVGLLTLATARATLVQRPAYFGSNDRMLAIWMCVIGAFSLVRAVYVLAFQPEAYPFTLDIGVHRYVILLQIISMLVIVMTLRSMNAQRLEHDLQAAREALQQDIAQRRLVEAELDQHRHRLEALVQERTLALEASKLAAEKASKLLIESINSIDQGFTVFDEEDRLLICNETYRRTYETSRDLLVPGTRFEDILRQGIARGQYPSAMNDIEGWLKERLQQHREAHGQQIEQRLDDGRWLLITEQRTPSGYIAGNRIDITERKQVEIELENHRNHLQELVEERTAEAIRAKEAAEAANRAKSTFLTNISHELRTPMHAILSFGGLGLQKSSGDKVPVDKLHAYFEHIVDSASRLMVLINDLLDLSKLEAGKTSFEMRPGDPGQIIDEAVREVDILLRQKKIRLEKQAMPSGVLLECDPFKIGQVMRNVLSNAIKFSPAGSPIRISLVDAGAVIELEVEDRGPGIPEAERKKIFGRFARGSSQGLAPGLGLRLALLTEVVASHGGTVEVASGSDGGSRFRVRPPKT